MARTTLEMFIKIVGANKVAKALDNVSDSAKRTHNQVEKNTKSNAKFAAGMSGLGKTAIAGGALFAAKSLADFSLAAIQAASSAQEAAGAFGTTFGNAAEQLNKELAKNANLFGLTQSEAQQLISVFGSVAQGIGFTQQESADLSSELFVLAGDIASFNNITAGAEPVLQAFRSALVGEREALKTYGIAITEAEVQTKAFEQTGKTSADALTRQEKALATTELLFERATVQIGNAQREASGFAAQTLIARSATQELREEIGEELLPAAGEILKTFNSLRTEATPRLIERFEDLNYTVIGLVETFNNLRDVVDFKPEGYDEFLKQQEDLISVNERGIFGFRGIGKAKTEDIEKTQELIKQLSNYEANVDAITRSFMKNRNGVIINRVAYQKFGEEIDKKLNPIFGEQNALLLSNIQLEQNRYTLLKLLKSSANNVAEAEKNRSDAMKRVEQLQIDENVRDAEAAIRKAELKTQIALLTDAQDKGKDVTLDLELAMAELAETEYELANDSDTLISARENLQIAEDNLKKALDTQKEAIDKRNEALYKSEGFLDDAGKANDDYRKKVEDAIKKQDALLAKFREIERAGGGGTPTTPKEPEKEKAASTTPPDKTPVPDLPATGGGNVALSAQQRGLLSGSVNVNLTDSIGNIIQEEVIKIQERGNTLVI